VENVGNKYCVVVTALTVRGLNLHQGEVVEASDLGDLRDLLLKSGMIRKVEDLALAKTTPVAA
jgi:hypothetical protein